MRDLELGHDQGGITIPIRNHAEELRGVLRYHPASLTHKMLAVAGTRLGLIPHPARERSPRILLVEGPPDMIAARSQRGRRSRSPATTPGDPSGPHCSKDREVTVVMDSDTAGRDAARRVASDLSSVAAVRVVDLAPGREDGFDLTDWLLKQPQRRSPRCTASLSSKPTITR